MTYASVLTKVIVNEIINGNMIIFENKISFKIIESAPKTKSGRKLKYKYKRRSMGIYPKLNVQVHKAYVNFLYRIRGVRYNNLFINGWMMRLTNSMVAHRVINEGQRYDKNYVQTMNYKDKNLI